MSRVDPCVFFAGRLNLPPTSVPLGSVGVRRCCTDAGGEAGSEAGMSSGQACVIYTQPGANTTHAILSTLLTLPHTNRLPTPAFLGGGGVSGVDPCVFFAVCMKPPHTHTHTSIPLVFECGGAARVRGARRVCPLGRPVSSTWCQHPHTLLPPPHTNRPPTSAFLCMMATNWQAVVRNGAQQQTPVGKCC